MQAGNALARKRNPQVQIDQFMLRCRPNLAAELHRLRQVCDVAQDERAALAKTAEFLIRSAAAKDVEDRRKLEAGTLEDSYRPPDMRTIAVRALVQSAEQTLGPEQVARFRAELDSRDEYHKTAIVRGLVTQADDVVSLSPEQEATISAALLRDWQDQWYQSLAHLHDNSLLYLQHVAPGSVLPVLDNRQAVRWTRYFESPPVPRGFLNKGVMDPNGVMAVEELGQLPERESNPAPAKRAGD
jgi:hypothetical protein